MRKNLLALSIAAMVGGLSGAANAAVLVNTGADLAATATTLAAAVTPAVALNPTVTGVGHILVVPYFTTQGTNATLLNLVNTDTVNGKAVKLRFRGASNSDDIFDITIFLSPGDMWTANVSASGELSALTTSDNSCTLPSKADIVAQGGLFKTGRVLGAAASETREGYIEILNMADIPPAAGATTLFTAIKHVPNASGVGVAPCTAATMNNQEFDLLAGDATHDPVVRGYSWPTGTLMANWTIVNLADKASFSGEAIAVRAETAGGLPAQGNIVFFPQTTDTPTYPAAITVANYTADPVLRLPAFAAQVANYDFPDLSTPYAGNPAPVAPAGNSADMQATALAGALQTTQVVNEFLTGGIADFATDWVFSMPTRRYAVGLNYAAAPAARLTLNAGVVNHFTAANTLLNATGTQACVLPGGPLRAYDHEENTKTTFVISPDVALRFCGETSVLSFNSTTGSQVLGAKIATMNINAGYAAGWLRISTAGLGAGNGLPIVGYAAAKAKGVNLGGTWAHRTAR
ncbi:cell surface protein [Simplicispira sedimenti]|uniref:cell surface protein n=1 Tax=Simplicispira sedimenti TaxID=2919500 RepID=UPI001FAB07C3|nr:cell surface protein [Acidovorax sp. W1-6]